MSNNYQYEPVTDATGIVVTEEDLHKGLNEPMDIRFDYGGYRGFTARFLRSKVSVAAVLAHQTAAAQLLGERSPEENAESEDMAELIEASDGLTDEQIVEKFGQDTLTRLQTYLRTLSLINTREQAVLFPIRIEMLAPAIIGWNVPGEAHTVENLKANGPLALAVIPRLWSHYQNFTLGSVADAETTPSPSTPSSATTSPSEKDASHTGY